MKCFFSKLLFFSFLLFSSSLLNAQVVRGIIKNSVNEPEPAMLLTLKGTEFKAATNARGYFRFFGVPAGTYTLVSEAGGPTKIADFEFNFDGTELNLGDIYIVENVGDYRNNLDIAVITIDELEQIDEDEANSFSTILTASRDPFDEAVAFSLGAGRFRARGYFNEDTEMFLNGMPVNDLDDGRVVWNAWGGLNDVTRVQSSSLNLRNNEFSFGGIGGANFIDLRASMQRVQTRAAYSFSNRTYDHRAMFTKSTGMMENGWAVTFSGSVRYGDSGFVPATHFNGASYFLSVDRKLNNNHTLNFVFLGAPFVRGRSNPSFQEMNDIAGTNYYNPNWGFQNGEVRNSREDRVHQPIATLRHDWKISPSTTLMTAVGFQFGKFGSTRLDWYLAPDPRPDYYRKLPFAQLTPESSEAVRQYLSASESNRQVQWDDMYQVNSNRFTTVMGPDGTEVSGKLSAYVVEEQRFDNNKLSFNSVLNTTLSPTSFLTAGLSFVHERSHQFKVLDDLLGGDFYTNIDRFAIRDFPGNPDVLQNDLRNPNAIVREGDIFGWNFDINTQMAQTWVQYVKYGRKFDFFASAKAGNTSFSREGYMQNGRFPDNSFGTSPTTNFFIYGGKTGLTYKIDGRNYFYGVASFQERAPFSRFAFLSPRTRDELVDNLTTEKITSAEIGYIFRYQGLSGRVTGFYTTFQDQMDNTVFYHDELRTLVNYVMTGVDKRHTGIEFGLRYNISQTLTARFAGSVGQYIFTSRPTATITQDNKAEVLGENRTIYIKNYYVGGTPQTAGTFGMQYRSPKFWSASFNINGFANNYLDFNPDRRTKEAVQGLVRDENPELWDEIIGQEKLDDQITVDIFLNKSWRVKRGMILGATLSVTNVLDNQNFVTGGFEQFRFDYEGKDVDRFPPRYFYAFGRTYSLNVTLSF